MDKKQVGIVVTVSVLVLFAIGYAYSLGKTLGTEKGTRNATANLTKFYGPQLEAAYACAPQCKPSPQPEE